MGIDINGNCIKCGRQSQNTSGCPCETWDIKTYNNYNLEIWTLKQIPIGKIEII